MAKRQTPWHEVRRSPLHGNGVFALRDIPAGTNILPYTGARITPEEADAKHPANPDDPFHTFFFALSSGKVIDGGQKGNDARWINHSCAPNCETQESHDGTRVTIVALCDIKAGEELFYDYGLVIDEEVTEQMKLDYRCLCGAADCRGTMLALPDAGTESGDAHADDATAELAGKLKRLRKKHKKLKKQVRRLEKKTSALLQLLADPEAG